MRRHLLVYIHKVFIKFEYILIILIFFVRVSVFKERVTQCGTYSRTRIHIRIHSTEFRKYVVPWHMFDDVLPGFWLCRKFCVLDIVCGIRIFHRPARCLCIFRGPFRNTLLACVVVRAASSYIQRRHTRWRRHTRGHRLSHASEWQSISADTLTSKKSCASDFFFL